jgi:hypothetical protein
MPKHKFILPANFVFLVKIYSKNNAVSLDTDFILCRNFSSKILCESVANQTFRRTFRNSDFFQTHVHLGTLTFEKNQNHKNFLENFDLRDRLFVGWKYKFVFWYN